MKLNRITALLMLGSMPMLANSASYDVVELPTKDLSRHQYANSIDNTGLMLTTVNTPYNPTIDLSLIDLSLFTLTDPDAAAQGNFNAADLSLVMAVIKEALSGNSIVVQPFATNIGYKTDGTDFTYVNGFDVITDATNGYTFSLDTTAADSVNGTHIVGSMEGPFSQQIFTTSDNEEITYLVNEFSSRAFVQVDENVTALLPEDLSIGGVSRALAVNDNLQVAGSSSIGINAALQLALDGCNDEETRGDEPLEVCIAKLRVGASTIGTDSFTASVPQRAAIWQVDASGSLVSKSIYGLLFEPSSDITATLNSKALDINNSGVAVGSSSELVENSLTEAAAVFENGQTTRLLSENDLLPNIATSINDNGIVVGYRGITSNGVSRSKMFVVNRNSDDVTLVPGFFVSSSTFPRAINNNNLVVGDAEPDASQNPRGRNGFLYDIENDTFTNINNLISCDSPYTIIAANDINDSNEIIAEAVIRKAGKNIKGEIVLDDNGEQIILDNVVTVKLTPTGGQASECAPSEEEVELTERQGAGLGVFSLAGLLILGLLRRRLSGK